VEVPATLIVDGQRYPQVGVRFRGASSYMMVGRGSKRSLNISVDFVHEAQRVLGARTLNLLNAHEDPSFLRTTLFLELARTSMPAPRANFAKVVINGESWGIYVNAQQFNGELVAQLFPGAKGPRWKVKGRPGAQGGLAYIGEEIAPYRQHYELKTKESEESWRALITLCRTLEKRPLAQLEEALRPMLDLDQVLWFLAFDVLFVNADGYWSRGSDYSLFRDQKGVFRVLPHDANETFHVGGGGGPGARTGDVHLDPLVAIDDPSKPLRSRLLAVPALRARYLQRVRALALQELTWDKLGPRVQKHAALIRAEVKADTRKLYSFPAFEAAVGDDGGPGSLRAFAERRRIFLLAHPALKRTGAAPGETSKLMVKQARPQPGRGR
jgi:hypothetical protein